MNPDKTKDGALVSTYGCAQKTATNEFMLYRTEYLMNTGRDIPNEVIGYHIRQAFKPGEITAEEANRIGKELASRMSSDGYAYVVATHNDREHIHNHIICCRCFTCRRRCKNSTNQRRSLFSSFYIRSICARYSFHAKRKRCQNAVLFGLPLTAPIIEKNQNCSITAA